MIQSLFYGNNLNSYDDGLLTFGNSRNFPAKKDMTLLQIGRMLESVWGKAFL